MNYYVLLVAPGHMKRTSVLGPKAAQTLAGKMCDLGRKITTCLLIVEVELVGAW